MSEENREINNMSKNEVREEIDRMISSKASGSAFLTSDGSSQRYWKLKDRIGEGVDTL